MSPSAQAGAGDNYCANDVAIGIVVFFIPSGSNNIGIGFNCGYKVAISIGNSFFGYSAGYGAVADSYSEGTGL